MIRKVKGEFLAECAECGVEHPGGCIEAWNEFIADLRKAGWKTYLDGGEWFHLCPDCQ